MILKRFMNRNQEILPVQDGIGGSFYLECNSDVDEVGERFVEFVLHNVQRGYMEKSSNNEWTVKQLVFKKTCTCSYCLHKFQPLFS
eukprot:snap_masked-scaffold_27-processed-gene-4.17-mRNA-1 protein AED:1.00 eAED:1.00 QI:0/0/0/0/1/1/2/0/85